VKKQLYGGEFWSDGYYVSTVSKHGDESAISQYVKEQGLEKEYKTLHKEKQLLCKTSYIFYILFKMQHNSNGYAFVSWNH
jgi:hypothetical protein